MPETPIFIHLSLTTSRVVVGERIKKGTYRPCVESLPTSTLMGCFREHFELKETVSIGVLRSGSYRKKICTYSPFDTHLRTAKLPLTLQYLAPADARGKIEADIYVVGTSEARAVFRPGYGSWVVALGAMRSKGFGECLLQYVEDVRPTRRTGYLRANMRESDALAFGIDPIHDLIRPHYGYLFRPDSYRVGGQYERSLFIGTILTGPDFLVGEEYIYDR